MDQSLQEILDLTAGAGLDPSLWSSIPAALTKLIPGTKATILVAELPHAHSIGTLNSGFDENLLKAYEQHYSLINPWIPFWTTAPVLEASASDDTLPTSTFLNSEFYEGWMRPEGEIESAAGIKLVHDPDRLAMLAVHYGSRLADRYNMTVPRTLQQLAPQLRTSLALNRLLGELSLADATLTHVIDLIGEPAFVLDHRRNLRLSNAPARAAIVSGSIVHTERGGSLTLADPAASRRFEEAISGICGSGQPVPSQVNIGVTVANPAAHVRVSVFPIVGQWDGTAGLAWLFAPARLALVVLHDGARMATSWSEAALRRRFRLTPAEARLAMEIAGGTDLTTAANRLGVARETVRSQLRAVFAKTDTHRQAELVALLARNRTDL